MSGRRLPPFGREVAAILRQPDQLAQHSGCTRERATVWIATGFTAWDWHDERPRHLIIVLPAGADPAAFDWRFLRGHDPILLVGAEAENVGRRREIARALLRDGVRRVLAGDVLMESERSHERREAAA
jgi:hypothetical protein